MLERRLRERALDASAGKVTRDLSLEELSAVLRSLDARASSAEVRALFDACDVEGLGTVDYAAWLNLVRPPLSDARRALVEAAWRLAFGPDKNAVAPAAVVDRYAAAAHPEVIARRATEAQVRNDFLATFDVGADVANMATLGEFVAYHTNVGAGVESDDYFDLLVRNVWGGGQHHHPASKKDNTQLFGTPLASSQPFRPARKPLSSLQHAKREPSRTPDVAGRVTYDTYSVADAMAAHAISSTVAANKNNKPASSSLSSSSSSLGHPQQQPTKTARRADAGLERLLLDVRTQLAKSNARGLVAMARALRHDEGAGGAGGGGPPLGRAGEKKKKIYGSFSAAEFRAVVKQVEGLDVTDSEARLIFDYFDPDRRGLVDGGEVLEAFRPTMDARRQRLVRAAFDVLDAGGHGAVEPTAIARSYDAARHPEVLSGRRTADQVFQDFLESFDVGGDVDGRVTAREFDQYYSNVSASIDDDEYFDLMMRNTWHLHLDDKAGNPEEAEDASLKKTTMTTTTAGGRPSSSARPSTSSFSSSSQSKKKPPPLKLKLAVTRADGTVSLEEIIVGDDLRPHLDVARDERELIRRLRLQGINAVAVAEATSRLSPSTRPPRTFREVSKTRSAGGGALVELERTRKGKKMTGYETVHGGMFGSHFKIAHQDDSGGGGGGHHHHHHHHDDDDHDDDDARRRRPALQTKTHTDVFQSVLAPNMRERYNHHHHHHTVDQASLLDSVRRADFRQLLDQLRGLLVDDGARGLFAVIRRLRHADSANSRTLAYRDFVDCLEATQLVQLAPAEAAVLCDRFDDGSGASRVAYEAFIAQVRGDDDDGDEASSSSEPGGTSRAFRRALVDSAFDALDADKTGFVSVDDVVDRFDATRHPDVLAHRRTHNDVHRGFLDTFEVGAVREGFVTRDEFQTYYATVGASVPDDAYFELMIRNAWHIAGGDGWVRGGGTAAGPTTNDAYLRVLVTHADGTQSVQLLDDPDLIDRRDTRRIMRLLRAKGVDVKAISLTDAHEPPPLPIANNTFRSTFNIA